MLIPGPICSIRAECGRGSRPISLFLTSESDSTGRKPFNINPQIACDIPSTFWTCENPFPFHQFYDRLTSPRSRSEEEAFSLSNEDGVFWTQVEERGRRRRDSSSEKERDSRASRAIENVLFGDFHISNENSWCDLSVAVIIGSP